LRSGRWRGKDTTPNDSTRRNSEQRTGAATFFHPQSGQQYVVEGFIIGAYNIACSLAAILLAEISITGRIKVRTKRARFLPLPLPLSLSLCWGVHVCVRVGWLVVVVVVGRDEAFQGGAAETLPPQAKPPIPITDSFPLSPPPMCKSITNSERADPQDGHAGVPGGLPLLLLPDLLALPREEPVVPSHLK
jgi:hypothetical protein